MPKVERSAPKQLRPYLFHGMRLDWEEGRDEAIGDCIWCGKERKFSINVKTGSWKCWVCAEGSERGGGGIMTFLRLLHERSVTHMKEVDYQSLVRNRKYLSSAPLKAWGVCRSIIAGDWLVPGYGIDGQLRQLYRYIKDRATGKMKLLSTPDLEVGLQPFGMNLYDAGKVHVWIAEGPWDGMALWEVLRSAHGGDADGRLKLTGNEAASLYADTNVVAVPGCGSIGEPFRAWLPILAGKQVTLLFDADHPKKHCQPCKKSWSNVLYEECPTCHGPLVEPVVQSVGLEATKRAVQLLAHATAKPESVSYLHWGDEGYDAALPDGTDVRDVMVSASPTISERVANLNGMLESVRLVPPEWVAGRGYKASAPGSVQLDCVPCSSWRVLIDHWHKAMRFTEGLDRSLSVMLACILSTPRVGEQLWARVLGAPSCLHGDTPIHDPVDGTTLSVRERWRNAKAFFVYTRKSDGSIGVAQALSPERKEPAPMYEVLFKSGRSIKVTAGHRFWDGMRYVSLSTICAPPLCASYHLPTISDTDLSTRLLDVLRSRQKVASSQDDYHAYSCSYDEQPQQAVSSGRGTSPLQDDAQEHSHRLCDTDGLDVSGIYTHQPPYHPSSCRISHRAELPLHAGVSERQLSLNGSELSYGLSSSLSHTPPLNAPGHKERSTLGVFRQTSSSDVFLHACGLLFQQTPHCCQSLERFVRRFCHPYTSAHKGQFGHLTSHGGMLDALELLLVPYTSWPLLDQYEESCNTPPASPQTDKVPSCASWFPRRGHSDRPFDAPMWIGMIGLSSEILTRTDEIVKISPLGTDHYYDFHVPETENYWAEGFFHHNSGKSTLCEALSVARQYVYPKDNLKGGLTSGYQADAAGSENLSMIERLKNKTLVINDGDTLLQLPNRDEVMSQLRAFYGRNLRTQYGNRMSTDWEGINTTIILCGTESLRTLDTGELGERFLTCRVADVVDEDEERLTALRVARRSAREIGLVADGTVESRDGPEMVKAKQLTGGYVCWLRERAEEHLGLIEETDEDLLRCVDYGTYVSYLRSRQSIKQEEKTEKEMPYRLTGQMVRLAYCLAVVLNRQRLDDEVMRRVRRVAMDSSRGRSSDILDCIHSTGNEGADIRLLAYVVHTTEEKLVGMLSHMRRIGMIEKIPTVTTRGTRSPPRWVMTPRLKRLYRVVVLDGR